MLLSQKLPTSRSLTKCKPGRTIPNCEMAYLSTSKSQNGGTEPGVQKGKRSLLACHTRCKCSIETTHNWVKVKYKVHCINASINAKERVHQLIYLSFSHSVYLGQLLLFPLNFYRSTVGECGFYLTLVTVHVSLNSSPFMMGFDIGNLTASSVDIFVCRKKPFFSAPAL